MHGLAMPLIRELAAAKVQFNVTADFDGQAASRSWPQTFSAKL